MVPTTWLRSVGWITATGMAFSAAETVSAGDDSATGQPTTKVQREAAEDGLSQGRVLVPKYRLGAALAPVPAALNERLDLKGIGLLIERVAPGGPADKAGIKPRDILLAVGDKPIKRYTDLVEWSNASGGKLALKLLRGNTTSTVMVMLSPHRKGDEKIRVPDPGK